MHVNDTRIQDVDTDILLHNKLYFFTLGEIAVDIIGPWTVIIQDKELEFFALTIVDQVTTLSEFIRIDCKDSNHAAWKLEQAWLCRYPRLSSIIQDQGTEVKANFAAALERIELHGITTTVWNPPGNAVCERMHLNVGDILCVLVHMSDHNHKKQQRN
jgi:hypothetical protein